MRMSCLLVAVLLAIVFLGTQSAFSQGPLTPPGAPAPTMKSLDQVEARTPITNTTGVTISQPGSYYLTTNITVTTGHGIVIGLPNVTLDLNGFTISSTANPASGLGIMVQQHDVTILNGHIVGGVTNSAPGVYNGSGFLTGIGWFAVGPPVNVRVSGVSISGCQFGINLLKSSSTAVQSCTMQAIGVYGIYAGVVSDSVVLDCGDTAIYADTVSNCRGTATGSGAGINATEANNCYGSNSGIGTGVVAVTANNCSGTSSNGTGLCAETANNCRGSSIFAVGLSTTNAINCTGISTNGVGLIAENASNCRGRVTGSGAGLIADNAINCYGWCSASGTGLIARVASGCSGVSSNGVGLSVYNTSNSRGETIWGTGMVASVAVGCSGLTLGGASGGKHMVANIANSCDAPTPSVITLKYNMP